MDSYMYIHIHLYTYRKIHFFLLKNKNTKKHEKNTLLLQKKMEINCTNNTFFFIFIFTENCFSYNVYFAIYTVKNSPSKIVHFYY